MPDPYVHVDPATFAMLLGGDRAELDDATDHHLRRVLRLGAGDHVVLSDGRGSQAPGELADAGVALTGPPEQRPAPVPRIHVVQALAKGRGVEEVVRAVTELGVAEVTVVAATRSVVKLRGDKQRRARDRWEEIARSAAAQARRAHLPSIAGPVDLAEVTYGVGGPVVGLVPDVGANNGLARALNARSDLAEVRLAIGPEGGWTDDELATFAAAAWQPVTLGSSVLRTEHAGLAAAAATAALVGWMD